MKNLIYFFVVVSSLICVVQADVSQLDFKVKGPLLAPKGTMLLGGLVANNVTKIPKFNIFFNGKKLESGKDGTFRCKTEADIADEFFILVGQYSVPKPKKYNTMHRVTIKPDSKHRFFRISTNFYDAKKWSVEEVSLKKYNYEVPQQTFIITMNPEIIPLGIPFDLKVYQTDIKTLMIPKLVLKQNLTNKELQKASAKSLLYPLGSGGEHGSARFHESVLTEKTEMQGKHLVVISEYHDAH